MALREKRIRERENESAGGLRGKEKVSELLKKKKDIKSKKEGKKKQRREREKSRGLGQRTPAVVGMAVDAPGVKRRAGRPCAWLQGVGNLLGASGA